VRWQPGIVAIVAIVGTAWAMAGACTPRNLQRTPPVATQTFDPVAGGAAAAKVDLPIDGGPPIEILAPGDSLGVPPADDASYLEPGAAAPGKTIVPAVEKTPSPVSPTPAAIGATTPPADAASDAKLPPVPDGAPFTDSALPPPPPSAAGGALPYTR
jgi:hypothetical protein